MTDLSSNVDAEQLDKIIIKNLVLKNTTGVDSWQRLKSQPIVINACLYTDITAAGNSDHVSNSIHYGHVTKAITKLVENQNYKALEDLALAVVKLCCVDFGAPKATISVEQPKALLHADASGVQLCRTREDFSDNQVPSSLANQDTIFVKNIRLHAIIGVNPWEREEKQVVIINLAIFPNGHPENSNKSWHLRTIIRTLTRHIESSGYKTLEAFAIAVARIALEKCHVQKLRVRVEKPSAILFADASGIEITRDVQWLRRIQDTEAKAGKSFAHFSKYNLQKEIPAEFNQTAYIALGSNISDRMENIYTALDLLEKECSCAVVDSSFLYETSPMYYTDQSLFLNAVCKVATSLDPYALLDRLKWIEETVGRTPTFRNGPRPIDLDILFYNDLVMDSEKLTIPHKSIQEREFVLRPLCDIAKDMEHPKLYKTCGQLLSQLLKISAESDETPPTVDKVIPIMNCNGTRRYWTMKKQTFIMGILNVTPDSFSDGGSFMNTGRAVDEAKLMKQQGADIIDIGGMSTRPGADDTFSEEEETSRVVPVVEQLRKDGFDVPISIDTFRANVAEAAINAGATMINDISGGSRDPSMLDVVSKHKVPVCIMHMRGDAKSMMSKENTTYENDDVVDEVSLVLHILTQRAIAAGIYRWNIIVDPGIGFAKTAEHDFEILRRLSELVTSTDSLLYGFPLLMGPSRKKFIGHATNVQDADKRSYGTAGAVAASIAGGTNILRVHDVKPMWEVARVCDFVWKNRPTK